MIERHQKNGYNTMIEIKGEIHEALCECRKGKFHFVVYVEGVDKTPFYLGYESFDSYEDAHNSSKDVLMRVSKPFVDKMKKDIQNLSAIEKGSLY